MKFIKNHLKQNLKILLIYTFLIIITLTSARKHSSSKPGFASLHMQNRDGFTKFNRNTPANDWGNNNIFYLDRHDVKCNSGEALQGFRLIRPNWNQLSYKYTCKQGSSEIKRNTYDARTPENATAWNKSKSANYLDRHSVECKQGYALQRFKLDRNGDRVYYSYTCVEVSCGNIRSFDNERSMDGGFETIYLDRQKINLKENEVMTGFKLNSSGGKFWYKIFLCDLKKADLSMNNKNTLKVVRGPTQIIPQPVIPKPKINIGLTPKPLEKPIKKEHANPIPGKPFIKPIQRPNIKPLPKPVLPLTLPNIKPLSKPVFPLTLPNSKPLRKPVLPLTKKNVKSSIEMGSSFCKINCKVNLNGKNRMCIFQGKKQKCKRCTNKPIFKDIEKKKLCEKVCDSIDSGVCNFYGYLNNKKKEEAISLLSKYGLKIEKKK